MELRNIFIDISAGHAKFLKVVMGLLLLGIIHKGSFEVFFKYCPRGSSIEFFWVAFHTIQPIIVSLDPASSFLSSNAPHEVGTLLVVVLSNG